MPPEARSSQAVLETAPGVVEADPREIAASSLHETFLRNKNFGSLNGVRAISCLAVIFDHLDIRPGWPKLFDHGHFGVDAFFVMSGFLIVTLLIREREGRGSIHLGKFYARRTLRIFPIYYLLVLSVFAACLAISPWKPRTLQEYAWAFPVLLTYTQDLIPAMLGVFAYCWSLAVEEQFYLVWPAIEKYAAPIVRIAALLASIGVNIALGFGCFDGWIIQLYGHPSYVNLPVFLITFTPILLGVALAYLLYDPRTYRLLYPVLGRRSSPIFALALLFAVCELGSVGRNPGRLGIHVAMMMLIGSLVIREDHAARPVLSWTPLARIGAISYGVYLYHFWVILIVFRILGQFFSASRIPFIAIVPVVTLTIIVAEVSFRWIEQPLLRLKVRYHS